MKLDQAPVHGHGVPDPGTERRAMYVGESFEYLLQGLQEGLRYVEHICGVRDVPIDRSDVSDPFPNDPGVFMVQEVAVTARVHRSNTGFVSLWIQVDYDEAVVVVVAMMRHRQSRGQDHALRDSRRRRRCANDDQ